MTYICAGMYRSGSTWLYNAVRLILKNVGVPELRAGWIADRNRLLPGKNLVIKVHAFDRGLVSSKTVVLTSHRDLRDVASSICRKSKRPFAMAGLRETVEHHAKWSRLSAFDLRYEDLLIDKRRELQNVTNALRLPGDATARLPFDLILKQIEDERFCEERATPGGHDTVNLLHKGHITDGRHGSWPNVLSGDAIRAIETEFRPWLTRRKYLPFNESFVAANESKLGRLNRVWPLFSFFTNLTGRNG
jgi:hypothetical protein